MISYNGFINLQPPLVISKDGKTRITPFNKPKSFFNNKDTHSKLLFLLDNEYEIIQFTFFDMFSVYMHQSIFSGYTFFTIL
jgi:hypothetical protein